MNNQDFTAHTRSFRSFWLAIAVLLAVTGLFQGCAWAEFLYVYYPPELWGNLMQNNDSTCGPVAVTNSLVYLQRLYSSVYDGRLVPSKDPLFPTVPEEQAVSTALATFMGTNAVGTTWDRLYLGKKDYISGGKGKKGVAPGTTSFSVVARQDWPSQDGPKPKDVQDKTYPTAQFIYSQLRKHRDIELLVTNDTDFIAHWVTITGIRFDTEKGTGKIYYVDPRTGGPAETNIEFHSSIGDLTTDAGYTLSAVVTEGPSAPEPCTLAMLGPALLGIGGFLRKRLLTRA
jgi:hypothetical protein